MVFFEDVDVFVDLSKRRILNYGGIQGVVGFAPAFQQGEFQRYLDFARDKRIESDPVTESGLCGIYRFTIQG